MILIMNVTVFKRVTVFAIILSACFCLSCKSKLSLYARTCSGASVTMCECDCFFWGNCDHPPVFVTVYESCANVCESTYSFLLVNLCLC